MNVQLTWQLLLMVPFLVFGIINGWSRGWREGAITTVVLLLALLFFGNRTLAALMGTLVNRIVDAFALFFSAIFGRDTGSRPLFTSGTSDLFRFLGFLIFAFIAYVLGSILGVGRSGRVLGGVLGAVNVFLVASQVFSYVQRFLPSVFQREGTIRITPDAEAVSLRSSLPAIFALLLVVLLIAAFLNLPRMKQ